MRKRPTISLWAIRPLLATLEAAGVDPVAFFGDLRIPRQALASLDTRIPLCQLDAIWDRAAHRIADDCLGMHVAETVRADSFGILSYLGITSATLGDALRRILAHFRLLSDASGYQLSVGDNVATVIATHDDVATAPIRQRSEFTVAVLHCYARECIGDSWRLIEAFFEHEAPADTEYHRRLFACPVRFGAPRMGFRFDRHLLDSSLRTSDASLADLLEGYARLLESSSSPPRSFAEHVREHVLARPRAAGSIKTVARELAMSPRTLQRRLRDEGTSIKEIIDGARHDLATRLLSTRGEIAEIAYLLGFSDTAAFHRAFKRWTGMTPCAYRQSLYWRLDPPTSTEGGPKATTPRAERRLASAAPREHVASPRRAPERESA
jgi:AraC-like DNA-binding protein